MHVRIQRQTFLLSAWAEAAGRLNSLRLSLANPPPMDVRDLAALVDRIHDLGSGDERAFSFAIADTARACFLISAGSRLLAPDHPVQKLVDTEYFLSIRFSDSSLSNAARALRLPSTQPPTWSQQRTRAVGNPHAVRNRVEASLSAIIPNIADECGESAEDCGGAVHESGTITGGSNLAAMTSPRRAQAQRAPMLKSSSSNANPFAQESLRSILPTDEIVVRSPSIDVFAETRDRIETSMKSLVGSSAKTTGEALFSYLHIGGKVQRPVVSTQSRRDTLPASHRRLDRKALSELALVTLDSHMIGTCDLDPAVVEAVALLLWQRVAFTADRIGLCEFCFGVDFLLAQHKKRILEVRPRVD